MTNLRDGNSPSRWSLAFCLALLTLAILAAYPLVGAWAYTRHGVTGLVAAAVAAAICWLGASLALVCTALDRGPDAAVRSLLLAMVFRMGLPLVAGLALDRAGGPLASAGVFGMVLVFYLLALAVETPLSLRVLRSGEDQSKSS